MGLHKWVWALLLALLLPLGCTDEAGSGGKCISSRDCVNGGECVAGNCTMPSDNGCVTNSDCADGQLCNTTTMMCVDGPKPCMNHVDCPDNQRCDSAQGICVDGRRPCTGMTDCPSSLLCDTTLGLCVECLGQNDCTAPAMCENGVCVGGPTMDAGVGVDAASGGMCSMDSQCGPPTRICENQQCVLGCNEFGGLVCDPNTEVCDTNTGRCVVVNGPCTMDSQCAPPQSVCEQGQCVGGCGVPGGIQCSGGMMCDMTTGRCVMGGPICRDDSDCMPPSTICNLNTGDCDPGCLTTGCAAPDVCNMTTGHCQSADPCVDDSFEDNDTAATAATIGAGTQPTLGACPSDDDFYALPLTMGQNASIEIRFVHGEGNLDIQVLDPSGMMVTNSTSQSDNEAVAFTASADGDYIVRVYSVQDFGPTPGNQYSMVTTVSGGGGGSNPGQCPSDMYEPNDSLGAAAPMPPGQYNGLTICPNEDDYFAITATAGQQIDISIISILFEGLVESVLLDSAGAVVAMPSSSLFAEEISYTSVAGGTYYLYVNLALDLGMPGNSYSVILTVQQGMGGGPGPGPGPGGMCMDDMYEENDDLMSATPLMTGSMTGLAACEQDDDFYSYDLVTGDRVVFLVEFMDTEGDIDLQLQNSSGTSVASAASASDNEGLDYSVTVDGTYYLRVFLYGDAGSTPGNTYSITTSFCDADMFEPNNAQGSASTVSVGMYTGLRLCSGSSDFYALPSSVGDNLDFTVTFDDSDGDIDLQLYDAAGTSVATTAGVTGTERLMYTTTSSGAHVLRVFLYSDRGTTPGIDYEMSIAR